MSALWGLTVDKIRKHDPRCDHDLEETCDLPTDVFRGAFGDVGWGNGGDGADAHARDYPSGVDLCKTGRATIGNCGEDLLFGQDSVEERRLIEMIGYLLLRPQRPMQTEGVHACARKQLSRQDVFNLLCSEVVRAVDSEPERGALPRAPKKAPA
jgi:hypothetical protein